jgi:preprotein translocase subunit SecB
MEQQLPVELDEIELIPQNAPQKLKNLFPTGSQFKINKVSNEGSEADFSVEITVTANSNTNKYIKMFDFC